MIFLNKKANICEKSRFLFVVSSGKNVLVKVAEYLDVDLFSWEKLDEKHEASFS